MVDNVWSSFSKFVATAANAPEPPLGVVVLTGITLVFFILVLLTLLILGEGKLFSALDKKKAAKAEKAQESAPKPPVPRPSAAVSAPAPVVEEGIPPEVVAAIAAAVSEIEGGRYTLRSVKTQTTGRGQWGIAGVVSHTEPF